MDYDPYNDPTSDLNTKQWDKYIKALNQKIEDSKYEKSMKFNDMESNDISMNAGSNEMLRVTKDGFYVRGVRVPVDEREALAVYESFKEWLAWTKLQQR